MTKQPIIKTERLLIREILPEDIDGMFELDSNARVLQFLGGAPFTVKQQSIDIIDFVRKQYIENGIGRWAVLDKHSKEFMGWAGLKYITDEENTAPYYDLGYRFIPRFWGKGFATEAANASLRFGFETINLHKIYAKADVENNASNHVLIKSGMSHTGSGMAFGSLHHNYRLHQIEWQHIHELQTAPKVVITKILDESQKSLIMKLWNNEYPSQLAYKSPSDFDNYLDALQQPFHILIYNPTKELLGWAFAFERDEAQWFAMIVDSIHHSSGIGSLLLRILKQNYMVLNGWVIDHDRYIKSDGTIYKSPIKFYMNNGFVIEPAMRLEIPQLSAVQIMWNKDSALR